MSRENLLSREIYLVKRIREIAIEKFDYDIENINDFEKLEKLNVEEHDVLMELGQVRLALLRQKEKMAQ